MALEIGNGAWAEELRRGSDTRGRIPLESSETVSPVFVLADLSRAPYRIHGVRWTACSTQAAGGAGLFSQCWIKNNSPSVQVIDSIFLFNDSGTSYRVNVLEPTDATADPTFNIGVTTMERGNAAATPLRQIECGILAAAAPGIADLILATQLGANTSIMARLELQGLDFPIRPGGRIVIQAATANLGTFFTVHGRFWDDVPRRVAVGA